jgi:hypothetical protein
MSGENLEQPETASDGRGSKDPELRDRDLEGVVGGKAPDAPPAGPVPIPYPNVIEG